MTHIRDWPALLAAEKITVSTKKYKDAIAYIDNLDYLAHEKEEIKIYSLVTCARG